MTDPTPTTDTTNVSPLAAGQIEIWKKIVDVQQHFNDLELRIRNFALIVTGAFLGLGGYAIKDGGIINVFGWNVSMAGLVVLSAIFPLLAFYFMDRLWYHRLLDGSVEAGIEAEKALKEIGYKVDLGWKISTKSPFKLWLFGTRVHSKTKMDIFYLMLVVTLLIVGICIAFGVRLQPSQAQSVEVPHAAENDAAQTARQIVPSPPVQNHTASPAVPAISADRAVSAPSADSDSPTQSDSPPK